MGKPLGSNYVAKYQDLVQIFDHYKLWQGGWHGNWKGDEMVAYFDLKNRTDQKVTRAEMLEFCLKFEFY